MKGCNVIKDSARTNPLIVTDYTYLEEINPTSRAQCALWPLFKQGAWLKSESYGISTIAPWAKAWVNVSGHCCRSIKTSGLWSGRYSAANVPMKSTLYTSPCCVNPRTRASARSWLTETGFVYSCDAIASATKPHLERDQMVRNYHNRLSKTFVQIGTILTVVHLEEWVPPDRSKSLPRLSTRFAKLTFQSRLQRTRGWF